MARLVPATISEQCMDIQAKCIRYFENHFDDETIVFQNLNGDMFFRNCMMVCRGNKVVFVQGGPSVWNKKTSKWSLDSLESLKEIIQRYTTKPVKLYVVVTSIPQDVQSQHLDDNVHVISLDNKAGFLSIIEKNMLPVDGVSTDWVNAILAKQYPDEPLWVPGTITDEQKQNRNTVANPTGIVTQKDMDAVSKKSSQKPAMTPLDVSSPLLPFIKSCLKVTVGNKLTFVSKKQGVDFQFSDFVNPISLLPALLVSAASRWALTIAKKKSGGFTVHLEPSSSSLLGYKSIGVTVSSLQLFALPLIESLRYCEEKDNDGNYFYNIDPIIDNFVTWSITSNQAQNALNNLPSNLMMWVD